MTTQHEHGRHRPDVGTRPLISEIEFTAARAKPGRACDLPGREGHDSVISEVVFLWDWQDDNDNYPEGA